MDDFADRVRSSGPQSGWDPFLPHFQPLIANLVREALPRSDAESAATAAAISHDLAFTTLDELALISTPTLVIAGDDARHPSDLAHALADTLPQGRLSEVAMSTRAAYPTGVYGRSYLSGCDRKAPAQTGRGRATGAHKARIGLPGTTLPRGSSPSNTFIESSSKD